MGAATIYPAFARASAKSTWLAGPPPFTREITTRGRSFDETGASRDICFSSRHNIVVDHGYYCVRYHTPTAKGCLSPSVDWIIWNPTGCSVPNAVNMA